MPTVTRWYLKSSFLYLLAAVGVGVWLALRGLAPVPAFLAFVQPVYVHLFLVGWVTQLIFGVVYWLFPPPREGDRHDAVWWATFILLNIGLLLRVVAEPAATPRPGSVWGWLLVLSALLQWAAALGFAYTTWPRARRRGRYSHERRQQAEES
ncbi:MAG: hypothetical protein R3272_08280 [Candidatus Promineifilaceae bacterium]|nr:hypothetical protein [Candidatus Promineifilaceae bacterium]